MADIVIFGGTTEGRALAQVCAAMQVSACECVVTNYGEQLLPESEYVKIRVGAMDGPEMEQLLRREAPRLVLDATHPYAAEVSRQVKGACEQVNAKGTGVATYYRVLREELLTGEPGDEIWVGSIEEAVTILGQDDRPVLVTTGSKDLHKYQALGHYRERVYARVLASLDSIRACEAIGLPGSHIIAMQGPFTTQFNEALLRQIGAGWLVTKESGARGGFLEKLEAARAVGASILVVGRPVRETGISLEEACRKVAELSGSMLAPSEFEPEVSGFRPGASGLGPGAGGLGPGASGFKPEPSSFMPADSKLCHDWMDVENIDASEHCCRELYLIGMGMGSLGLMTMEAAAAIRSCEALLGAPRLLETAKAFNGRATTAGVYLPGDVLAWLKERPWIRQAGILLSGDTGFYSGAKGLRQALGQRGEGAGGRWRLRQLPGISAVSYLCARVGSAWEDVYLCSLHGRDGDVAAAVRAHPRVFCLLGGNAPVPGLCRRLADVKGYDIKVTIGEWLSYPQERIASGTPEEIGEMGFGGFCAALIERTIVKEGDSE